MTKMQVFAGRMNLGQDGILVPDQTKGLFSIECTKESGAILSWSPRLEGQVSDALWTRTSHSGNIAIKHIAKCETAVVFSVSIDGDQRYFFWLQDKTLGTNCLEDMSNLLIKSNWKVSSFSDLLTRQNLAAVHDDPDLKTLRGGFNVSNKTPELIKAARFLDQLSVVNALNLVGLPEGITNFHDLIIYLKRKKTNNASSK